jgi:hypothetical protein
MEGTAMQFVVWVETMIAGQAVAVQRAAVVERQCPANVPTELGLTLHEGRAILTGIEQEVVQSQVELQSGAASLCEHCQGRLRIKDIRKRRLDTVFGRAAELLNEMLPGLNRKISHTAIRRHTLAVGA